MINLSPLASQTETSANLILFAFQSCSDISKALLDSQIQNFLCMNSRSIAKRPLLVLVYVDETLIRRDGGAKKNKCYLNNCKMQKE